MTRPELSIVVPVYNEAEGLEHAVADLDQKICSRLKSVEVLLVDDGSKDATPQVLDRLTQKYPYIRALRQPVNRGHGPTIRTGFEASTGELIFQIDSDGQIDPQEFWKLHARMNDCDVAVGYRSGREDPVYRLMSSGFLRWVLRPLFGVRLRDPNCAFKLFKRKPLEEALALVDPGVFAPSILLLVAVALKRFRIAEEPIRQLPREFGQSSIIGSRYVKAGSRVFREILQHRNRWRSLIKQSRAARSS